MTDDPSSGQPGGRGRRFGHAAAAPQSDRNRQDVGTATETRPAPMARRPAVLYDRPASLMRLPAWANEERYEQRPQCRLWLSLDLGPGRAGDARLGERVR